MRNEWLGRITAQNIANQTITNMAGGIANAATRSVLSGTSFGDNLLAALPDMIGQTVGGMIGAGVVAEMAEKAGLPLVQEPEPVASAEETAAYDKMMRGFYGGDFFPEVSRALEEFELQQAQFAVSARIDEQARYATAVRRSGAVVTVDGKQVPAAQLEAELAGAAAPSTDSNNQISTGATRQVETPYSPESQRKLQSFVRKNPNATAAQMNAFVSEVATSEFGVGNYSAINPEAALAHYRKTGEIGQFINVQNFDNSLWQQGVGNFSSTSLGAATGGYFDETVGFIINLHDDGRARDAVRNANPEAFQVGQMASYATGLAGVFRAGSKKVVGELLEETAGSNVVRGLRGTSVVSPARAESFLVKNGFTPADAKDFISSFDGPITARIVRPGEGFLRYTDNATSKGSFLTKSRFPNPNAAVDGLFLSPFPNRATLVQPVTSTGRSIVLEGGIRNGGAGISQTVIHNRGAFYFGPGVGY